MAKPGDKDTTEKKPASVADAPDSVSDKQKEDSSNKEKNAPKDVATETTQTQSLQILNTLVEKQQETTDGILALIEATEGNKETKEDEKEEDNKRKSFFDGIKGMFKKVKEGTPDFFKGLKEMMGKYKKILLGLLGGGLVAFFATMKMEDFAKLWGKVKETLEAAWKFLKPIADAMWEWLQKTAFPSMVTLLIETWDNIATLFKDLSARFKGWTEGDWGDKLWMVVGSLSDIGKFVINSISSIVDHVARLFGYESETGSITTDIMNKFSEWGTKIKETFKTMLYAILPDAWADSIIKKLKEWFGDDTSTPEDESLVGRLGGIFKGIVGALAISALFPGGFALLAGGLITVITTLFGGLVTAVVGITSAIFTWPVLLGVAIAAFVIWVGKLIYDNWDAIKDFFVNMWESVTGFFKKGIGKLLSFFGVDADDRTVEEIEKDKIEATKKAQEDAKKVREQGANLAVEKKDLAAIEAEMTAKENAMDALGNKSDTASNLKRKELATAHHKLRLAKIKIMDEEAAAEQSDFEKIKKDLEAKEKKKKAVLKKTTGIDLEQLKMDEGFRSGVYEDTVGIKTVGYGFNLERAGAQEALDAAGIEKSLADLKSGDVTMTEEEADRLMRGEYPHFADAAKRFVGADTWNNLTLDRQKILTNMAYNMGEKGLNQFQKLKAAIKKGDWKEAQVQMASSKWAGQVKGRSDRLVARMGQSDTGIQLAAAQTAGGNLDQQARSNIIIAPSSVNQNNNSTPLHLAETTFTNDQVDFHSG